MLLWPVLDITAGLKGDQYSEGSGPGYVKFGSKLGELHFDPFRYQFQRTKAAVQSI